MNTKLMTLQWQGKMYQILIQAQMKLTYPESTCQIMSSQKFLTSWDSKVSIATHSGPDSPGIESWWERDFLCCPDQPRGPSSLLYNG